ncbi:hypothetical protein [Polynucleobacter necessarius]|nr:hypothetical protein [Polynucleobacter necessarius]
MASAKAPEVNKSAQSGEVAGRQFDCKPQVHQKTGSALPCPAPD